MRTRTLFGTVAAIALMGTMAGAQTMDEPDRLFFGVDAEGTRLTDDAGEPLIVRRDGTPVPAGEYEIDDEGIPRLATVDTGADPVLGANEEIDEEGNRVTTRQSVAGAGGEFVVEQAEPEVTVMVDEPRITVDQATPEVTVRQPQPQITVRQAEPQVRVEQAAPVITVTQEQPIVTVRIPEPVVTIRLPEPNVDVETSDPEVQVQTPQPVVRFVRPEPQIVIEEAEPQIEVMQGEAQVNVQEAGAAEVTIEQEDAQVEIEEADGANVEVTTADPEVNVEQAEGAEIQVEQGEAEINVEEVEEGTEVEGDDGAALETEEADVTVVEGQDAEMNQQMLVDAETRSAGLIVAEEDDAMRTSRMEAYGAYSDTPVAELVGMNVLAESGEDVGEIDNVGMIGDRLVAIVGVGGFLGLGEHDVAVPLERIVMQGDDAVIQGMSAEMLENMDEYNADSVRFLPADGMVRADM